VLKLETQETINVTHRNNATKKCRATPTHPEQTVGAAGQGSDFNTQGTILIIHTGTIHICIYLNHSTQHEQTVGAAGSAQLLEKSFVFRAPCCAPYAAVTPQTAIAVAESH